MQSERRLLESRIARLWTLATGIEDDELRAELAKHLCVLASGLLEVGCRDILNRYAAKRCDSAVGRFVADRLTDLQSPRVGNMLELLTSFDPHKAQSWFDGLTDEQRDSVDSIVNNRHQIAHGRSIGLSFDTLRRYYGHATQTLSVMEKMFPPTKG